MWSAFTALASARQLLWLLVTATASGAILLVPVAFVSTAGDWRFVEGFVRAVHSAASLLLVLFSVVHGVKRVAERLATPASVWSGTVASIAIALAAISGAVIVNPSTWRSRLGGVSEATLVHGTSIFHYGYSTALAFAAAYWHVRIRGANPLLPLDRGAIATVAGALLIGTSVAVLSGRSPPFTTGVMVPAHGALAWWTVAAPLALWIWWLIRLRRPTP